MFRFVLLLLGALVLSGCVTQETEKTREDGTKYIEKDIYSVAEFTFHSVPGEPRWHVYGVKIGCFDAYSNSMVKGLCWSFPYSSAATMDGLHWGFINDAYLLNGVQMGVIYNRAPLSACGFQMALFNHTGDMKGAQIGMINYSVRDSHCQLGVVNVARYGWCQIGAFNVADRGGFQIGVINVIKNGWIMFMPLMNIDL